VSETRTKRFEAKFIPEPNTGCWLWTAARRGAGYGGFRDRGRIRRAHRVSYEIYNNVNVSSGIQVLHKCDTPLCVNPDHIFLGTHADNMKDMALKGRSNSKINEVTAKEVKKLLHQGCKPKDISKELNINVWTVYDISQRRSWKYIKK